MGVAGFLGIENKKTSSSLTNANVSSQYGAAIGATIGGKASTIGAGATSLISTLKNIKVGKGATVTFVLPTQSTGGGVTPLPRLVDHFPGEGIGELQDNQSLNTLNNNPLTALAGQSLDIIHALQMQPTSAVQPMPPDLSEPPPDSAQLTLGNSGAAASGLSTTTLVILGVVGLLTAALIVPRFIK